MDQIAIGLIRTSHGVKGLLKVVSYSGEWEHFLQLKKIFLKKGKLQKEYLVERVEPFGQGLLIKLKGIDSPEAGKTLAQWEIWVDKEMAAPLEKGEFYHADLIDCEVVYQNETVGKVVSMIAQGKDDLMEVRLESDGSKKLVPFIAEFVGDVDIDKKCIELLKDWILE